VHRPASRWGSYDSPPDPLVGWGGGYPVPIPHPTRLVISTFAPNTDDVYRRHCKFASLLTQSWRLAAHQNAPDKSTVYEAMSVSIVWRVCLSEATKKLVVDSSRCRSLAIDRYASASVSLVHRRPVCRDAINSRIGQDDERSDLYPRTVPSNQTRHWQTTRYTCPYYTA